MTKQNNNNFSDDIMNYRNLEFYHFTNAKNEIESSNEIWMPILKEEKQKDYSLTQKKFVGILQKIKYDDIQYSKHLPRDSFEKLISDIINFTQVNLFEEKTIGVLCVTTDKNNSKFSDKQYRIKLECSTNIWDPIFILPVIYENEEDIDSKIYFVFSKLLYHLQQMCTFKVKFESCVKYIKKFAFSYFWVIFKLSLTPKVGLASNKERGRES